MPNYNIQKTVYLVRHGQSEHNVEPVFQSPESPLSVHGRKQAGYIAERVAKLSFDALIASPFSRARETAESIAKVTGKTPEYSELFTECHKPAYLNGKPYADQAANRIWREWETSLRTSGLRSEEGENYDSLVARADQALEFLLQRPEESIVVVSHGFFMRTMVARVLLGNQLSDQLFSQLRRVTSMENTGLTVLRYYAAFEDEPRWHLWVYNDHAHLG